MPISARNRLQGRVKHLTPGAVNTEVTGQLPGGADIVSIMTKASAEQLHLTPRMEVSAVITSSDVLMATDATAAHQVSRRVLSVRGPGLVTGCSSRI